MTARNAWIRLWYLWAVPLAVVAVNLVWLAWMRGTLVGQDSAVARRLTDAEASLTKLENQAAQLDRTEKGLAELREDLDALRKQDMAPMRQRLVPFLTDVLMRTQEAGLKVERVAYAAHRDDKSGLVYFSAGYGVKGTYEQIRRCAYLLESSPQFAMLEGLALRGDPNASSLEVSVQLVVGTYFADLDEGLMKQLGVREVPGDR